MWPFKTKPKKTLPKCSMCGKENRYISVEGSWAPQGWCTSCIERVIARIDERLFQKILPKEEFGAKDA